MDERLQHDCTLTCTSGTACKRLRLLLLLLLVVVMTLLPKLFGMLRWQQPSRLLTLVSIWQSRQPFYYLSQQGVFCKL